MYCMYTVSTLCMFSGWEISEAVIWSWIPCSLVFPGRCLPVKTILWYVCIYYCFQLPLKTSLVHWPCQWSWLISHELVWSTYGSRWNGYCVLLQCSWRNQQHESLSYTHGTMETTLYYRHGYQKIENIPSKAEQKVTFARYQSCYTNSTEGTVCGNIWKNQQPPTVFLNIRWQWDSMHATDTNDKLTFFQKVLIFSDGKQSFEPHPIVLLGLLLFRLDPNSSHMHGRQ